MQWILEYMYLQQICFKGSYCPNVDDSCPLDYKYKATE